MREAIFRFILAPLIRRNQRMRAAGKRADKWYWADSLAARWGMWKHTDYPSRPKVRLMTVDEVVAFDRAFESMDTAFCEMDKAFKILGKGTEE